MSPLKTIIVGSIVGIGLGFGLLYVGGWIAIGVGGEFAEAFSESLALRLVVGSAIAIGLAAGFFGDRFWEYLQDSKWWRLWP